MKTRKTRRRVALLVVVFVNLVGFSVFGCSIPPQGYVEVRPYVRNFDSNIESKVTIIFEDVPDKMVIKGTSIKRMEVSDFRRTFGNALSYALKKNFAKIARSSKGKTGEGLELVIHRIHGKWVKAAIIQHENYQNFEIKLEFQFDATFYINGEKVSFAEGSAVGDESTSSPRRVRPVYASAVVALCKELNRALFPDKVQALLIEKGGESENNSEETSATKPKDGDATKPKDTD